MNYQIREHTHHHRLHKSREAAHQAHDALQSHIAKEAGHANLELAAEAIQKQGELKQMMTPPKETETPQA